jgi:hypothetical protein
MLTVWIFIMLGTSLTNPTITIPIVATTEQSCIVMHKQALEHLAKNPNALDIEWKSVSGCNSHEVEQQLLEDK